MPARLESEIIEALIPDHFKLEKTSLHGFPFKPTAVAFDPVQKVLAIGNRCVNPLSLDHMIVDVVYNYTLIYSFRYVFSWEPEKITYLDLAKFSFIWARFRGRRDNGCIVGRKPHYLTADLIL